MILAAGFGTRLRPLTDKMPKPLLPVGGRPMIDYNLSLLKKYGITEVVINLHYHGDKIIEALGNGSRLGMDIVYSRETEIMGTGGGIKKASSILGQSPFIVINGDILIDINLDKLVSFHLSKGSKATLVVRKRDALSKFGSIEIDETGLIRNILGKLSVKRRKTCAFMFTGLHILDPTVLGYIPAGRPYSIIDAYLKMLGANEKLFGFISEGYWNDLGHIDRYHETNQAFKGGRLSLNHMQGGK